MQALTPHLNKTWEAGEKTGSESKQVTSPTDGAVVGTVYQASPMQMESMMTRAQAAFPGWAATSVDERADILERAADLFEANQFELMAICVREAGKTLNDAVAEIREAIDFLRYYAMQGRKLMAPEVLRGPTGESNTLHLHGRGVFVCISPWNFPLAIFTGQVAAALVTGNCVLAKPADQTPLIAARAVALLHEAGIGLEALQLVPGRGSVVGEALLKHNGTAGVCFTGSVPTALHINRTLAAREGAIVPLIAETGGQNCMVVDSTALIEQAVDDILLSAFGSAGQRCSALRVLYVQEEIADHLIEMLKAAMSEMKLGNPAEFATDIGPVIDVKARDNLQAHIDAMMNSAKFVAKMDAPATGSFLSPHAFEISDIGVLTEEHFGPILHIIRFKASELAELPTRINATGFGLTFGLHSRIEEHWQLFQRQIKAGNCYINRSMIGATVGVQPFGGEGLSGTGPKAGGPHYLTRFCIERTVTINTAAIGGNLELLAR
jgi:RHH-type proline utilization regulon transcriptional repressor/proline dehydrogenase/delta 1-pyrroline-5-carboxylate dehydrogenase